MIILRLGSNANHFIWIKIVAQKCQSDFHQTRSLKATLEMSNVFYTKLCQLYTYIHYFKNWDTDMLIKSYKLLANKTGYSILLIYIFRFHLKILITNNHLLVFKWKLKLLESLNQGVASSWRKLCRIWNTTLWDISLASKAVKEQKIILTK